MVTITSSYTVTPNESTPSGRLWLSDLDQLGRFHHTQLIFIYQAKDNQDDDDDDDAIERLRNSLAKILVPYYPIAGRFCWTESGRIELELNAKGAVLLAAETTKKISDYVEQDNFFLPNDSTKELVPVIDYNQPIEEIPLFVVQLTRFHGNNNNVFVVGIALSHALCDGISFFNFINSWAKISRGETINVLEPSELPFLDRTMLKFSHTPATRPRFDHIELEPLPLVLGTSDDTIERNKKMAVVSLRLTANQVEMLKKKANESDARKEHHFRPYSRYEAISAHIWRCVSKARELKENQPTFVRFIVEIRNRMILALPPNYFGNACIQIATKGYVGEIISKPLGYVAQKIREANEKVTDEYIKSQIDVIRAGKENKKGLFLGGEDRKVLLFCGNPNLRLVNWMSLPAYEVDFGWGKAIHYGLAHISSHDRGIILSSPYGDGSVIVCMHFQVAHMQLFKKFFYGDIHEIFTPSRM